MRTIQDLEHLKEKFIAEFLDGCGMDELLDLAEQKLMDDIQIDNIEYLVGETYPHLFEDAEG